MSVGGVPRSLTSNPPNEVHATLETLLFKATNPANKVEDVNTIKQFCDIIGKTPDGPGIAGRLLSHKIQSPQEREAIQALAVVEAAARSSPGFVQEIGKFRFLNEMIKLVSPKYLGTRTPESVKQRVIELLYSWTKHLPQEKKIQDAYEMLKAQGVIGSDPTHVGGAVFAASLPRREADLSQEDQERLQKLLQSSNPEDLERANRIIKGMVKKEEEKMERATRLALHLQEVQSSTKLLSDMLNTEGHPTREEREVMGELFAACERLRPGIFRMAAETEENDPAIGDILYASDEMSRVMEKYKEVIILGKKDSLVQVTGQQLPPSYTSSSSLVQELFTTTSNTDNRSQADSDDLLEGFDPVLTASAAVSTTSLGQGLPASGESLLPVSQASPVNFLLDEVVATNHTAHLLSELGLESGTAAVLDRGDLLASDNTPSTPSTTSSAPLLLSLTSTTTMPVITNNSLNNNNAARVSGGDVTKRKGLAELDQLSETAIRQHLPETRTTFDQKKLEKLPLLELMKQKSCSLDFDTKELGFSPSSTTTTTTTTPTTTTDTVTSGKPSPLPSHNSTSRVDVGDSKAAPAGDDIAGGEGGASQSQANNTPASKATLDCKLSDISLSLSDVTPQPAVPPLLLQDGGGTGLSAHLHFTTTSPRPGVAVFVLQLANTTTTSVEEIELRPAVPRGCRVRLLPPPSTSLPPAAPFSPPPTVNQLLLVGNPTGQEISLSYVLSYSIDREPVTDMGKDFTLPPATDAC